MLGTTGGLDMEKQYKEYDQHMVPHIMQDTHWDCGLACVAMLLQGMNVKTSSKDLAKQCTVESIWTIDLAYLLGKYATDFTYYTSYFGSRKEYQMDSFYKANFDEDELRVNHLFSAAKRVLPLDDFKRYLSYKRFALLVLVNARLLECVLCKEKHTHLDRGNGDGYLGHFVVLIGYDSTNNIFIYRDPATEDSYCVMSTKDLDHARQAQGTDHDCNPIVVIEIKDFPHIIELPRPPTGVGADYFRLMIVLL
ncbi:Guanylylate cyclase-domain-containing protein [Chlamydoabsidia padenii]|nr:Guanylylate cyclase-domain-containing protein [Chlamydoabsidia padenii]